MDTLFHDLRYALRTLLKSPGFTAVVVTTLTLGIGANTTIFSVVHGVLLRQLPYAAPDRLVMLWGSPTDGDSSKVTKWTSYLDFVDIREQATSFEQLAAFRTPTITITGRDLEPRRVDGAEVTSNLFPTLGISPTIGRALLPGEDQPGAGRVAVLSHALWQSRFGADRSILGRPVMLDGIPHTVVGVMPREFQYPRGTQLWLPLQPDSLDAHRGAHRLQVVGRLRPGSTREQAEAEVRVIARQLEERHPADNAKRSARLEPMREALVGDVRPALLVLLGAVGLVLLIACTNVANLCLARATARQREVAIRAALGARRARLMRQLLTESLVLALVGGAGGLLFAVWGVDLLVAAAPQSIPRAEEIGIDHRVLAFTLFVSVLTGLGFGVAPALRSSRWTALSSLREGGKGASERRGRLTQALVVSEVALAVVLMIGAALLIKSFWQLQRVDPGFDPDKLLTVQLQLPLSRYGERSQVRAFYQRLQERLEAAPGVRSVAVAFEHPLSEGWTTSFTLEGREQPPTGQEPEARMRPVTPGYFRTVGVPLLKGRDISARDAAEAPGVVVVNEAFVRRHFPGEDPIGKRLNRTAWWPGMPTTFEIIGVVGDERFLGLQQGADPATYFPFSQFPMNDMYLLVRTTADPHVFVSTLRRLVWAMDRDLPLEDIQTMEQILAESVAGQRFNTSLLTLFASAALLLAAVGIYGVLSYTVTRRTGEIGIRMALGARRGSVLRLIVGQGMMLALTGVALGVGAALAVTRLLASLLHGVSTTDSMTFASVALLLTAVALLATYIPARRATRIDPTTALRYE